MKKLLVTALVCFAINVNAQSRIENDTLFLSTGEKFVKGDDLVLGSGSNVVDKSFNFVMTNPTSIVVPSQKLGAAWAGLKMQIHGFKLYQNKKRGDKAYIVLSGGNLVKYWCDIVPAIANKEVITGL